MCKSRALLLDLDDTLYPEKQYVESGLKSVAMWCRDRFGYPPERTYLELSTIFNSGNHKKTFDEWFSDHGIDGFAHVHVAVENYRRHEPAISCFPGTAEMLARLKQRFRLGIVSDGYLDVQERKLAALNIAKFFDVIVFSDRWGREYWKPHPRPFQAALEALGVQAGCAVYVGDNPAKDFVGAKALGILTIRLFLPESVYAQTEAPSPQHEPDITIRNLLELESLPEFPPPPLISIPEK